MNNKIKVLIILVLSVVLVGVIYIATKPIAQSEGIALKSNEPQPLKDSADGILKTIEFAFADLETEIKLDPDKNAIDVTIVGNTDNESTKSQIEQSAKTLSKSLKSLYNFDGEINLAISGTDKIILKNGNAVADKKDKSNESKSSDRSVAKTDKPKVSESKSVKSSRSESKPVSNDETGAETPNNNADIAYWNNLALQYGFQPYNGYGDFNQFVASAQTMIDNANNYGDPYYTEPVMPETPDEYYPGYYEDDDYLYENPIYSGNEGPEEYTEPPVYYEPPTEPELPMDSYE